MLNQKVNLNNRGIVLFITFIITSMINVITIKTYTKNLSLVEYSVFTYLQSVFVLLTSLLSKWLCQSIYKFNIKYTNESELWFNTVIFGCGLGITIIAFPTILLLDILFQNKYISEYFWELYLIVFSTIGIELLNSWTQAKFKIWSYSLSEIARCLLRLFVPMTFMVWFGNDIKFFLLGYAITNSVVLIIQILLSGIRLGSVKFKIFIIIVTEFLKYGMPLTGWFLCSTIMTYIDRLIIGYYWPINQVGIWTANVLLYGFAAQIISLPFINSIHPVLLAIDIQNMRGKNRFQSTLNILTTIYIYIVIIGCVAVIIFSDEISTLFFDSQYRIDSFLVFLIVMSTFFWNLGSLGNKPFEIFNLTGDMLKSVLISLVIYLIISIVLIPYFSYTGAGLSKLISSASYPIILYFRIKNKLPSFYWVNNLVQLFLMFFLSISFISLILIYIKNPNVSIYLILFKLSLFIMFFSIIILRFMKNTSNRNINFFLKRLIF